MGVSVTPKQLLIASNYNSETIIYTYTCFRAVFIIARLLNVQLISLLTLYAAGNYFVVSMLSSLLHNSPSDINVSLPFSWFFWLWTILLPFVYVLLGIKNKNLMLLRIGLLLVVLAGLTFRMIFHLLPTEYALVLSGTVLPVVAIVLIKYLKTPKNGFTYTQRSSKHWANNIKSRIIDCCAGSTCAFGASSRYGTFRWRQFWRRWRQQRFLNDTFLVEACN